MRVTITVNGERREADDVWEGESLLYVLRERMGLPGSKNACEQGECGSCTVYLDGVAGLRLPGRRRPGRGPRRSARSRASRDGDELHPVQQAFVEAGAVQCGFCTPGPAGRDPRPAGPRPATPTTPRSARRWPATCAAAPATRRSSTPCAWRGRMAEQAAWPSRHEHHRHRRARTSSPWTPPATEHAVRPRRRRGQPDHRGRRRARARATSPGATGTSTAPAAWSRPGLVNTHHHLYQWVTRGLGRRRTRCSSG